MTIDARNNPHKEHKTELIALQLALIEGEQSGPAERFYFLEFISEIKAQMLKNTGIT